MEKDFTQLEQEFRTAHTNHQQTIKDKLKEAQECIDEAIRLSNQYMLPFTSEFGVPGDMMDLKYVPESLKEHWNLEEEDDEEDRANTLDSLIEDLCGVCGGVYDYSDDYNGGNGWQYSSRNC